MRAQRDGLVAGVISSFIVIVLQFSITTASRIVADMVGRRWPTRSIWRFKNPRRIYVVSGSIESITDPAGTAFLAGPDAEAVAVVRVALSVLYPKAEIVHTYAPSLSRDLYNANIVAVGGPVNNRCTRDFLLQIPDAPKYENLDLVTSARRYSLEPITEQNPARTDYGLVISTVNPFSESARWVIISGCDTSGVLAAATVLSPLRETARCRSEIRRKIQRFRGPKGYAAVVSTLAIGNLASPPHVEEVEYVGTS
ncbi:hypothetical protein [Streptomyces sp. NPDC058954]|uniref:hypothetical protein n=1 Tax=Streptomyces sp. NPDC058954 TaxID=3346677 RepID=UPI0036871C54